MTHDFIFFSCSAEGARRRREQSSINAASGTTQATHGSLSLPRSGLSALPSSCMATFVPSAASSPSHLTPMLLSAWFSWFWSTCCRYTSRLNFTSDMSTAFTLASIRTWSRYSRTSISTCRFGSVRFGSVRFGSRWQIEKLLNRTAIDTCREVKRRHGGPLVALKSSWRLTQVTEVQV